MTKCPLTQTEITFKLSDRSEAEVTLERLVMFILVIAPKLAELEMKKIAGKKLIQV